MARARSSPSAGRRSSSPPRAPTRKKPKAPARAAPAGAARAAAGRPAGPTLLRALFSAPHCLLRLDASGRIAEWNHVAEAVLGGAGRRLRGRPLAAFLGRGEEEWREIRDAVKREGGIEGRETFLRAATDGAVPVSLNVFRGVFASPRDRDALLVVARDLRPAREREDEAARRDQMLANILTDSVDAIVALDTEGRVILWNRGAERLLGYSAEEMMGQRVDPLVPPDLLREGELEWLNAEVRRRGAVAGYETRRVARDGRELRVSLTVTAIRDPQGRIVGRSSVVRDITESKELHERLLQSERLAAIGTIASKVAHDIRNPLSSLLLNAELLGDELGALGEGRAAEARAILAAVQAELDRLAGITEDYLQFARPPHYRAEPCPLNELLNGLLELLQPQLRRSGITARCDFDEQLPEITGDREQLRRALLNLLRNAVEAMPGGGMLTLTTRAEVHDVLVTVADTGAGIQCEDLDRVFTPFFSTKQGGTGLGLAVAGQIVTDHGGRLTCQNRPGEGALFTIRLPRQPRKEGRRLAGEVLSRRGGGEVGPYE